MIRESRQVGLRLQIAGTKRVYHGLAGSLPLLIVHIVFYAFLAIRVSHNSV